MPARAKVALVNCKSYDFTTVLAATERLLAQLGCLSDLVAPGQKVLLKPNLLSGHAPDEMITTHPEVVRALIHLIKRAGANPVVADSSASAVQIEQVWEATGFRAMCASEQVPLINLERSGSRSFSFNGVAFSIAKPILDADVLINVPKLKTHVLTVLTNAVKNMYGTIPGYQKTILHKHFPNPTEFGRLLAKLYTIVRPSLTVTDAIVAMEGSGPLAGQLAPLGFLAAAHDGVALDTALCHLLGIDPRQVPYFDDLQKAAAGQTRWDAIELSGDPLEQIALRAIRLPKAMSGKVVPNWLKPLLAPFLWIRPRILANCKACGLCVKACPVGALIQVAGQAPKLQHKLCIACCCCYEICPSRAIAIQSSPLFTLAEFMKLWLLHGRKALSKMLAAGQTRLGRRRQPTKPPARD